MGGTRLKKPKRVKGLSGGGQIAPPKKKPKKPPPPPKNKAKKRTSIAGTLSAVSAGADIMERGLVRGAQIASGARLTLGSSSGAQAAAQAGRAKGNPKDTRDAAILGADIMQRGFALGAFTVKTSRPKPRGRGGRRRYGQAHVSRRKKFGWYRPVWWS